MTDQAAQVEDDRRRRAMAAALLDWYRAAGVDAAVTADPIDWLAQDGKLPMSARELVEPLSRATRPQAVAPATAPPPLSGNSSANRAAARPASPVQTSPASPAVRPAAVHAAPEAIVREAQAAARGANTLAELRAALEAFEGCGLKATAKNLCFFRGAEQPRVMVVGEAPGRDEDRAGIPFVGRAGQLLDKMLAAIGLDETSVHITNVVYWRPPGNRTPTPVEVQSCQPFLERQIELVAPEILVTVGGPASKALLNTSSGIMKLRGKWQDFSAGPTTARLMPTLHPAYLLRTPAAKRLAWRDLIAIKEALGD